VSDQLPPIDLGFLSKRAVKHRPYDIDVIPYSNLPALVSAIENGFKPMNVMIGPVNGPDGKPVGMDYVVWLLRENSPLAKVGP
jgi:hypothetical protein